MKIISVYFFCLLFSSSLIAMHEKKSSSSMTDETDHLECTLNPLILCIVTTHLQLLDARIYPSEGQIVDSILYEQTLIFSDILKKNLSLANTPDSQGRTPLMHAAAFALIPFVKALLEADADNSVKDLHDFTAYKHAKGKPLKRTFKSEEFPQEFVALALSLKHDRQLCKKMLKS